METYRTSFIGFRILLGDCFALKPSSANIYRWFFYVLLMAKATKSSKFFDVSKSIFVGGLDNRVTEEMLWELFLQVGVTKQRLKLGMPANRLR